MELRHLRYFVAVAEELHFLRAAQRLHIEQSPLSRAIKDLEADIGVKLLERTTRSTRLTPAGEVFLMEARQVLSAIAQARASARGAATGRKGRLRIAFAEGIAQPRLSDLIAEYRKEAAEVEVKVTEMPLQQQVSALHAGSLDAGFAFAPVNNNGIQTDPVWVDPVMAILPSRHPLAIKHQIALKEIAVQRLVLCGGDAGLDRNIQLQALLSGTGDLPNVVGHAENHQVQLTLVGAGYGIGLVPAAYAKTIQRPDILVRPIASPPPLIKTFLVYRTGCSGPVTGFVERVRSSSSTLGGSNRAGR